jgi:hypothetical protein
MPTTARTIIRTPISNIGAINVEVTPIRPTSNITKPYTKK